MKKTIRKNILTKLAAFAVILIVAMVGCKKKDDSTPADTSPPVVKLKGSSSVVISLNSTYSDSGATATDTHDGSLSVSTNISATNPNVNRVKIYTITYTATDAAGNVGTAIRTVRVKNDAENYLGTYNVTDSCNGILMPSYSQIITIDSVANKRIHFNKFANYANNTGITAVMNVNSNLDITSQTATNIGSGTGMCDIADHTFTGTAESSLVVNGFKIPYMDQNLCPSGPTTSTCVSYFVKM